MPHSFGAFSSHHQRPERGSMPFGTGSVAHPSVRSVGQLVQKEATLLPQTATGSIFRVNAGPCLIYLIGQFTVAATGINPLTYRWHQNGSNNVGINSSILTLSNVTRSNNGHQGNFGSGCAAA